MTPEKTPEQWMVEAEKLPWTFTDFHAMALLAAQTIPNQTVGELLASADKIEAWLREPELRWSELEMGLQYVLNKKSPEKINPEASDGVSGD